MATKHKITRVGMRKAKDYSEQEVYNALVDSMDYIGGLSRFVKPGMTVLLKVNLLSPKPKGEAVTTHPVVVKVLCELIRSLGAHPQVGDSSGGILNSKTQTDKSFQVSGVGAATQEGGGKIINFDKAGTVPVTTDNPYLSTINLAKPVVEADIVISLAKFKTHSLTSFTGAVKNMYGAIPGTKKRDFHREFSHLPDFNRLLVDIYQASKPQLSIIDGIWGMEGNGPTAGNPKYLGILLTSEDGVALDSVASSLIGLDLHQVPSLELADDLGYGTGKLANIAFPEEFQHGLVKDFKLPSHLLLQGRMPAWVIRRGLDQLKTLPHVVSDSCNGCGVCRDSCPVSAINVKNKANIDTKACIECMCCHELCPNKAIDLQSQGILGKLLRLIYNN